MTLGEMMLELLKAEPVAEEGEAAKVCGNLRKAAVRLRTCGYVPDVQDVLHPLFGPAWEHAGFVLELRLAQRIAHTINGDPGPAQADIDGGALQAAGFKDLCRDTARAVARQRRDTKEAPSAC